MRTPRTLPDITKNVLQDPARTREQAAWELLHAVDDLFPATTAQLRSLGERYVNEHEGELPDDHPDNLAAELRFLRAVADWTTANAIACESVNDAAEKWAVGESPSAGLYVDAEFDGPEFRILSASISAYPHTETREEFLAKAGRHYDEVSRAFQAAGAKRGPVKRSVEHFRYLAVHLVLGVSFADIAATPERFGVPAATATTIAGEVRKVAQLIGLPLRNLPGPKPGTRRKIGHRARR
jgi:hypothetical protein